MKVEPRDASLVLMEYSSLSPKLKKIARDMLGIIYDELDGWPEELEMVQPKTVGIMKVSYTKGEKMKALPVDYE